MSGCDHLGEGERIAFHIGAGDNTAHQVALHARGGTVLNHGGLIHMAHREGDGRDVGIRIAVIGLEGEAVCAVEIPHRHKAEGAVAVERQRAVGGVAHLGKNERGALGIHGGGGAGEGGVLIANGRAVGSHRRRVEGVDHHLRRGGVEGCVACLPGLHRHQPRTAEAEHVADQCARPAND